MLSRDPPAGLRRGGALAENRHRVVDDLQEAAGHGEALLLAAVVDRVAEARQRRVSTAEFNRFLTEVTTAHPPSSRGSREVRILYGAQTSVAPPAFVLFTNVATDLHFSYERFLVNQVREAFGFEGTPIRLTVRRRTRKAGAGRHVDGRPRPRTAARAADRRTGRDQPEKG